MSNTIFFKITITFSCIFSFISWFNFYLNGILLWIPTGVSLLIILLCIFKGPYFVNKLFFIPGLNFSPSKILLRISAFIYFFSSMHGMIFTLWHVPINDKSVMAFPIIIMACIFSGAILSLIQVTRI